jgi:hypothetical protein
MPTTDFLRLVEEYLQLFFLGNFEDKGQNFLN